MENIFAPIIDYISRYINLTQEEADYFISLLKYNKLKKRQTIVHPDYVCKYRTYILKGSMRAYILDTNGKEHNILLSIEDWWIVDFESYINNVPASMFVEANEETHVLQFDYKSELQLIEKYPKFERLFKIMCDNAYIYLQKRMIGSLTKTGEEKYLEFVKNYPLLLDRFPQYAIASFLGLTPQFISKIKSKHIKVNLH